jgi:hypothetical protein
MNLSRLALLACFVSTALRADLPQPTLEPTLRAVDLMIGESAEVKLADGSTAKVKLLDVQEKRDSMAKAVREAKGEGGGQRCEAWLTSANYNLPQTVGGVQIDCPITRGYNADSGEDSWGLEKDARLRLWPPDRRGSIRAPLCIRSSSAGSPPRRSFPTSRLMSMAATSRTGRRSIITTISTSAAAKV